jgi:hypothetical protein
MHELSETLMVWTPTLKSPPGENTSRGRATLAVLLNVAVR